MSIPSLSVSIPSPILDKEEEEEEEGFIARAGIEQSQNRRRRNRCIPCHADVGEDLVRRIAAPATKATFYNCTGFIFLIFPDRNFL